MSVRRYVSLVAVATLVSAVLAACGGAAGTPPRPTGSPTSAPATATGSEATGTPSSGGQPGGLVEMKQLHYPTADPIRWLQACLTLLGPIDAVRSVTGVPDLRQTADVGDAEGWLCAFVSEDGSEALGVSFAASDAGAFGDIYTTAGAYSGGVDFTRDDEGTLAGHAAAIKTWVNQALGRLTG